MGTRISELSLVYYNKRRTTKGFARETDELVEATPLLVDICLSASLRHEITGGLRRRKYCETA